MEKNNAVVGIIGGAGVAATNKLLLLIEDWFTKNGAYRDAHHPQMLICQATNVPSRSMFLEGKGPSFVQGFVELGKKLKIVGVDKIYINCNTAHYAINEIEEKVGVPIGNLVEEVVKIAKNCGRKKIGLLVSDGTKIGQVYEKYFSAFFNDALIIYPDLEFQKKVTQGICNVKNKSRFLPLSDPNRPRNIFNSVVDHLKDKGAEVIILGCTDINVDFDYKEKDIIILDSLEILAKMICDYTTKSTGNIKSREFYDDLSKTINSPEATRNKAKESGDIDAALIKKYSGKSKRLLDLGSGTGLVLNKVVDSFGAIVAVEKYPEFSKYMSPHKNLKIINHDLLKLDLLEKNFDVVTVFATMNYFDSAEAHFIYKKIYSYLKKGGILIIKNQMGKNKDVIVNNFSEELQTNYYSEYRSVEHEKSILESVGFLVEDLIDIYPPDFNRWDNTHFYALICKKK